MQLTAMLLSELDREVELSRRALAEVPEGHYDWKPHEKSMAFGYLSELVAILPSWIAMMVTQNELDVAPATPQHKPAPMHTSEALLAALAKTAKDAHDAIAGTTDEFLRTPWKLLAKGEVMIEKSRHEMMRDTFLHLAHHRGQMTVYLRLLGATVPALYGPSADEKRFD